MPETHRAKPLLPPIPAKRYFTIGEVSELCAVKPHVLRYWEQEFAQLKPVKRRGNRRYYQHHEVLLIRRIRDLLYEQGFTINGARHRLDDEESATPRAAARAARGSTALAPAPGAGRVRQPDDAAGAGESHVEALDPGELRRELEAIREILGELPSG
ncbi:MAG TPA: MerR family transcriptional regulator [Casimicrobiaceae bacterium]|jgi:DNA-binding transcriptional MerR regulator|nr:MerR family transcriptional regulator [Casimicrobiaceae bacterium]